MIDEDIKICGGRSFICVQPVPVCYRCGGLLPNPAPLVLLKHLSRAEYLRVLLCGACKSWYFNRSLGAHENNHKRETMLLNNGERWQLTGYRPAELLDEKSFAELKPDKVYPIGSLAVRET